MNPTRRHRVLGVLAALLVAVTLWFPRTTAGAQVLPTKVVRVLTGTRTTGTTASASKATSTSTATASDSAAPTASTSTVGALFSAGSTRHSCTASVIHSSSGDLLLTAAHCITGTGKGMTFAPGYANGTAPYGYWTVTAVHAPSGWIDGQDADDDMAVLTVAPQVVGGVTRTVESVVGAEVVGSTPAAGTAVTATGYVAGTGGSAVTCSTTVSLTSSSPTLGCAGFAGGTSGGPWVTVDSTGSTTVVAMVSGPNQGGCTVDVSYSAPFDESLTALVASASTTAGQTLPTPGSDGC